MKKLFSTLNLKIIFINSFNSIITQLLSFFIKYYFSVKLFFKHTMMFHRLTDTADTRRVTRNFSGQGVFLELGHFHKHSTTTQERKAPQGKNHRYFCLETLHFKWEILPIGDHSQGIFTQIMVLLSNFWKRAGETSLPPSPPPPSSYAPAHSCICKWYSFPNTSISYNSVASHFNLYVFVLSTQEIKFWLIH